MLTGRSLLRLLVAAILACGAPLSFAQLPRGEDFAALAREARARHAPILIAFVQESCAYCAIAKRDYLVPMHLGAGARGELIMREVDIDSRASLKGCIDCHASSKTGSVLGEEGFCSSCHAYAAVKIDCFECHTPLREARAR